MSTDDDSRLDAYLWDPAAPASDEVAAIERSLAPARFDAARRPLALPPAVAPRRPRYGRALLAMAASLVVLIAGASAWWTWRWSWPAGAAWPVVVDRAAAGGAPVPARLELDRPLQLDASASARVTVARIGTMTVAPGSALRLAETTSLRHRVQLDRGAVSVRIWAPPGRFALRTPAGSVIDLGCVFDLSVEQNGTSRVRVASGWVQIENGWGESLIPAGAASIMAVATRPGVPIYEDAPPELSENVRKAEREIDPAVRGAYIDVVVRTARRRDVLTLLMLANTSAIKRPLLERAAQLLPPPPGVTIDAISAGNKDQLWRWYSTLDLPPAKNWWRNWRDALPALH